MDLDAPYGAFWQTRTVIDDEAHREGLVFVEHETSMIRPINWPLGCLGKGAAPVWRLKFHHSA
jgi:hypothetical protein